MPSRLIVILGCSYLWTALVTAAVCLPLLFRKVPKNWVYGFRTRRSMSSEEAWYAINEFAARRMLRYSAVLAVLGIATLVLAPIFGEVQPRHVVSWKALAAILPLFYCLIRPTWDTFRWGRERFGLSR